MKEEKKSKKEVLEYINRELSTLPDDILNVLAGVYFGLAASRARSGVIDVDARQKKLDFRPSIYEMSSYEKALGDIVKSMSEVKK